MAKTVKFKDGPLKGEDRVIKPEHRIPSPDAEAVDCILFFSQVEVEEEGMVQFEFIIYKRAEKDKDVFAQAKSISKPRLVKIPKGKVPALIGKWEPYHPAQTMDGAFEDAPKEEDDTTPAESE